MLVLLCCCKGRQIGQARGGKGEEKHFTDAKNFPYVPATEISCRRDRRAAQLCADIHTYSSCETARLVP